MDIKKMYCDNCGKEIKDNFYEIIDENDEDEDGLIPYSYICPECFLELKSNGIICIETDENGLYEYTILKKVKKHIPSQEFNKKLKEFGKVFKKSLDKIKLDDIIEMNKPINEENNYTLEYFDI